MPFPYNLPCRMTLLKFSGGALIPRNLPLCKRPCGMTESGSGTHRSTILREVFFLRGPIISRLYPASKFASMPLIYRGRMSLFSGLRVNKTFRRHPTILRRLIRDVSCPNECCHTIGIQRKRHRKPGPAKRKRWRSIWPARSARTVSPVQSRMSRAIGYDSAYVRKTRRARAKLFARSPTAQRLLSQHCSQIWMKTGTKTKGPLEWRTRGFRC
jgi:hypothetical protein